MTSQASKLEQSRALLASSALMVKNPSSGPDLAPLGSTTQVMWVSPLELETYERNPRTDINDKADEIEASIRAGGIDSIFQVARVPGRTKLVVARGGNTRLAIIQKILAEGPNPKLEKILVHIVEWRGHAAAIADHTKENTLRGDMSYWDKAMACLSIQREIALETCQPLLNVSALVKVLNADYGFIVDRPTLSRYLQVAEHFKAISKFTNQVSAKTLIPGTNALIRLAAKFHVTEHELWTDLHPALERYAMRVDAVAESDAASAFSAEACLLELQNTVAVKLQLTSHQLKHALSTLEVAPDTDKAGLMTSPEPSPIAKLLARPGKRDDESEELFDKAGLVSARSSSGLQAETGQGARQPALDDGSLSGLDTAVRQATAASGSPAQAGLASLSVHDGLAAPVAAKPAKSTMPLDVNAALDSVIDMATVFADACGIGDWIVTSRQLPCGYFMEIADRELDASIAALRAPVPGCPDARIRVAAWWLAAGLNQQIDKEKVLLLPQHSGWRMTWGDEHPEMASAEGGKFDVIQIDMLGVISEGGEAALHVEYITALMMDAERLVHWTNLCRAVMQLRDMRERSPQAGA